MIFINLQQARISIDLHCSVRWSVRNTDEVEPYAGRLAADTNFLMSLPVLCTFAAIEIEFDERTAPGFK